MIKRWAAFITIVLLVIFPASSFSASAKSTSKKKNTVSSKKETQKKSSKIAPKGKKSLKTRKNQNNKIAQETPQTPKPGNPMFKVTPLDNGKFLIEPTDSSLHQDTGPDQLSLIKKPVFEEESEGRGRPQRRARYIGRLPAAFGRFFQTTVGKSLPPGRKWSRK